jgi:hypothetical protein
LLDGSMTVFDLLEYCAALVLKGLILQVII